jgi:hypothetical protein
VEAPDEPIPAAFRHRTSPPACRGSGIDAANCRVSGGLIPARRPRR